MLIVPVTDVESEHQSHWVDWMHMCIPYTLARFVTTLGWSCPDPPPLPEFRAPSVIQFTSSACCTVWVSWKPQPIA